MVLPSVIGSPISAMGLPSTNTALCALASTVPPGHTSYGGAVLGWGEVLLPWKAAGTPSIITVDAPDIMLWGICVSWPEHPNEKGEYALIQEGTLCLFTGQSYEETANEEKFKIAFNTLSSQQKEQDFIECEIDDKFKFKSLKIELQDTDNYEVNPINETDKQKGTIKPCLFEKIPCPLRFKKKKF